jgi:hypothetical protein
VRSIKGTPRFVGAAWEGRADEFWSRVPSLSVGTWVTGGEGDAQGRGGRVDGLDRVVQAPGNPDEDTAGGFQHGGWHVRHFDEMSQKWVVEYLTKAGGFLLGRRIYEILAGYWPNASEEEQVVARPLNTKPKYVASTTLREPLEWENSSLIQGRWPRLLAR